jgi:hypothetical protein
VQRSIKGTLCSLLHQYLQTNSELAITTLQRFPALKSKEVYSDWSRKDLEVVMISALQSYSQPICIFLDGLDEVDPLDGQFELIKLVDKLCSLSQLTLKVCVSSRPEPVLQQYLAKFPMLRVQDLTRSDIRNYATDKLREYTQPGNIHLDFRDIVDALCDKADGVFLWVSLALKSLGRGLASGDSLEELEQRLKTLPSDLQQLYRDMWRRLNDDEQIFRKDAAFFLHCAMDYPLATGSGLLALDGYSAFATSSLTIFHVAMAADPCLADAILDESTSVTPEEFGKKCYAIIKRLETRCAGLLEVSPKTAAVSFIHRSVKEFLDNTAEGQSMMQHDRRNFETRLSSLLKADIAMLRIRVSPHYHLYTRGWEIEGGLPSTASYVNKIHHLLHHSWLSTKTAIDLTYLCEAVYETGGWSAGSPADSLFVPDFLTLTSWVGFIEFNSAAVQQLQGRSPLGKLSESYKSHLLSWAFLRSGMTNNFNPHDWFDRIEWLLNENADPSLPGIDFSLRAKIVEHYTPWTPLSSLLEVAVASLPLLDPTFPRCFNEFLKRGIHLTDTALIILNRFKDEFSLRVSWSWLVDGNADEEDQVIIRANLSFLLNIYLKTVAKIHEHTAAEAAEDISILSRQVASVPVSATLLALRIRTGVGRKLARFTIPESSSDIDRLMATLDSITLPEPSESYYTIPGLSELLFAVAENSRPITTDELMGNLVAQGLLLRWEDVAESPPIPF